MTVVSRLSRKPETAIVPKFAARRTLDVLIRVYVVLN